MHGELRCVKILIDQAFISRISNFGSRCTRTGIENLLLDGWLSPEPPAVQSQESTRLTRQTRGFLRRYPL